MNSFLIIFIFINIAIGASIDCIKTKKNQKEDTQQLSSAFKVIELDPLRKVIMKLNHIEAAVFSLRILSYGVTLFYLVKATVAFMKLYNWLVNRRRERVLIGNYLL